MASLALGDKQPALANADVGQAQPEDLAAAQPAQQHRLDHRLVAVGAQRADERVGLAGADHARQRARRTDQWNLWVPETSPVTLTCGFASVLEARDDLQPWHSDSST